MTLTSRPGGWLYPPARPPDDWFANPRFRGPTPVSVTADGRLTGHLAIWGQPHMDDPRLTPQRSASGYAHFCTRPRLTASGRTVRVGALTAGCFHAPRDPAFSLAQTAEHYERRGVRVADVAAGEDEFGIWLAGVAMPQTTRAQFSAVSGHWRPWRGGLELAAALVVPAGSEAYPVRPWAGAQ